LNAFSATLKVAMKLGMSEFKKSIPLNEI